jgi:hypothetical protein
MGVSQNKLSLVKSRMYIQYVHALDMADKLPDGNRKDNWQDFAKVLLEGYNLLAELDAINIHLIQLLKNSKEDNERLQEIVSDYVVKARYTSTTRGHPTSR